MIPKNRERTIKVLGLLALGVYGWAGAFNPDYFLLLNGANLLFHEAGHVLFSFFGESISIWGGTLLQLLIPMGLAMAFCFKHEPVSASVMAWWFGQNFFGISAYIKDARAQALPFVGGEQHDWEYILGAQGWLEYDQIAGNIVWFAGLLIITAAPAAGFIKRQ